MQSPHTPLPGYYGDESERQRFLRRIFDDTAADYDRIERLMALGTGPWYRRQALMRAGVGAGQHLLDVGTGTGLLAREALKLVGPAGSVIGVDPSTGMMAEAHLPPGVTLVQGRAEDTGRPADSADMLTMGYALRHVSDVDAAFAEFHRVLRPGGRAVVLEISLPASRWGRVLLKAYMRAVVPLLARLVARRGDTALLWRYYWDTIESCIAPPQVVQALQRAGFTDVQRHVELGIFSEYTARKAAAPTPAAHRERPATCS
jgi:demethylmenaquinone methyltransferase/2-methoxy-6-polyprenyl-1,4-benzoquinol methylase